VAPPPPELLHVAAGARAPGVRAAAQAALRDTYHMFRDFKVPPPRGPASWPCWPQA
jgi:hypothetical protein